MFRNQQRIINTGARFSNKQMSWWLAFWMAATTTFWPNPHTLQMFRKSPIFPFNHRVPPEGMQVWPLGPLTPFSLDPSCWPFCSHSSAAFISNSGSKWRITPGIKFLVDIGSSFHRWGSTYITTGSHLFLVEGAPHPPSQVRIFLTQGRP